MFDFLFRKKPTDPAPASPSPAASPAPAGTPAPAAHAPGTSINYDPNLVATLHEDHRMLLEIFKAISEAAARKDLATVQQRLEHFRIGLQDHLLKENVRLYVYLEHMLRGDPPSHELIHEFRREMDGIGRVVVGFLTTYKLIASQPELADSFAKELAQIGKALVARIEREESTLYPLYAQPVA